MAEYRLEGVVLRSIPYKERDRILTLFTRESGVISLYVAGVSSKNTNKATLTSPLTRGEFLFKKGRGDLYRFIDGTILDLHLPLRKSYAHLDVAGKLLKALLNTQLPGKEAFPLYQLLLAFLNFLPKAKDPMTLYIAFQIKLLKYEGLLSLTSLCQACDALASQIVEGESLCKECGGGMRFEPSEWETLCMLFETQSFSTLKDLTLPTALQEGMNLYFEQHLKL